MPGKKIAAIVTTYYPLSHADVIVTKFFHAFGYLVPENHIAYFRK